MMFFSAIEQASEVASFTYTTACMRTKSDGMVADSLIHVRIVR